MRELVLAAMAGLFLVPATAGAEELSVIASGEYKEPLAAYKVGESYYLSAKEAGSVYGAQVYWYIVSGRVQMSLRGRSLQFLVGSDTAKLGERKARLESPVMVRASHAYIPLSFFLSPEFSDWAGTDTVFNPRTKLLTVDKRSTVGPVRWFSYRDHTRIAVELSPHVSYSAAARGVGGLAVSFPLGTIESAEEARIADGLVEEYSLRQGAKIAKLQVKLAKRGLQWQARELSSPRRVVIDFYMGSAPPEVRRESRPETVVPETRSVPTQSPASPAVRGQEGGAKRRIVIDAGHGGKDPGATGRRGTLEKDINLLAAQDLARLLEQEGSFEILMTRADDTFVPLSDRSRLANEFGADLFLSLHCNASPSPKDSGFEVYSLSEKASDPDAERLAEFENSALQLEGKSVAGEEARAILQAMGKTENVNSGAELAALMSRALGKRVAVSNNGAKQAAFYVLRGTDAPAVLLEMAFISNKKDEAKLESRRFRRRLVDGVYAGVLDYAKRQGWTAAPD